MAKLLTDIMPVKLQLTEGDANGKVTVRGEFAKAGIATENKRVYPQKLWEKEIGRLNKALGERRVFGELDHPQDGRTSLNRVSHIITGLTVKNGVVVGEAEILPTDSGRNLKALLASGCRVGVSSRGYGSVKSNEKGEDVVQEDYKLNTFDFVAEPADGDAYPEVFFEGKEIEMDVEPLVETPATEPTPAPVAAAPVAEGIELDMDADKVLAAKFAERIEAEQKAAYEKARSEFESKLASSVVELKSKVRDETVAEVMNDPNLGGFRTAVEQVVKAVSSFVLPEDIKKIVAEKDATIAALQAQVAERDSKLESLQADAEKATALARTVGYRYFLEKQLSGDPDADAIRSIIGDVKEYQSSAVLKAKVEAVRKDLNAKREAIEKEAALKATEAEAARSEEAAARKKVESRMSNLEAKLANLTSELEEQIEENERLSVKLYASQKLTNHPRAAKIKSLIESTSPSSKEEVDGIFESFRAPEKDTDTIDAVRAQVRERTRGGSNTRPLDEEAPATSTRRTERDYNGLGVNLSDLRRISGMPTGQK